LTCIIDKEACFFQDSDFGLTVSNALDALEDVGHSLPLGTLQRCVEFSESNTATRAASMIAFYGNEEALAILLRLHGKKTEGFIRDSIVARIEELAARLGVRLVWDGDRLVRAN
jgi:hypothetical protein